MLYHTTPSGPSRRDHRCDSASSCTGPHRSRDVKGYPMRVSLVGKARTALVAVATVLTFGLSAFGLSGPAYASDGGDTYNNAKINIHGGNAAAFGGCVNYAKVSARHDRVPQSN